ncbi:ArsR family transcriptional regulator [Asanoa ferruginea]|uniref:ArsR family transcriptional regulator n=1 Tax=Asanoa ferruginea TaxID=53367 RepID=A0A3D9ZMF9_9ACTN|nr:winged helix-turn-helix domain-containing protein [Asanoa ferruginea]REF98556.1 ArsR family transcriptional regulator [Asanoa ferruginea]GIF53334.1 transcriptional regulator [Asanoa ferruginea]
MADRIITEVDELKAVTHPLRVRMLGALRADGPATATELARRFDTDTGTTSYHLRKLARFKFVEEAEQRDGRERRWQASEPTTSWDSAALSVTAEGRAAVSVMRRHQLAALDRTISAYDAAQTDLPQEWVGAAGMSDLPATLTPRSLHALEERVIALIDEFVAADAGEPDARPVMLFYGGFPRIDPPGWDDVADES